VTCISLSLFGAGHRELRRLFLSNRTLTRFPKADTSSKIAFRKCNRSSLRPFLASSRLSRLPREVTTSTSGFGKSIRRNRCLILADSGIVRRLRADVYPQAAVVPKIHFS
jgi:hypothetical protein